MIQEAEFNFINSYGKENIFLRGEFYKYICAMITDFFEEELVMNEEHKSFIHLLNNFEGYADIGYFNCEMHYYWAICIIQNKDTTDELINNKTQEDFIKWSNIYYKTSKIGDFLIETVDEDEYLYSDDNNNEFIFLTKKYYDFVCSIVTNFFEAEINNNNQRSLFLNRLHTLHLESSFKEIIDVPAYEWALRIVQDQEVVEKLNDKELGRYHKFKLNFFKDENITSFIVAMKNKL